MSSTAAFASAPQSASSPKHIMRNKSKRAWNVEERKFYPRTLPGRSLTAKQIERAQRLVDIKPALQPGVEPSVEPPIKRMRLPPIVLAAGEEPPPLTPASWWSSPDDSPVTATSAAVTQQTDVQANAPAQQAVRDTNWEAKALKRIQTANWSLVKTMSHTSWKQKTSNDVRLKLLKDDGYDISSLLLKGTTADQIIIALLAHIEERERRQPTSAPATSDNIGDQSAPKFQVGPTKLHLFTTSSLAPQKRKHSHEDDNQPEWQWDHPRTDSHNLYKQNWVHSDVDFFPNQRSDSTSCTCGMESKRRCLRAPAWTKKETTMLAKTTLQRTIARKVFEPLRKIRKAPQQLFAPPMEIVTIPEPGFVPKPPTKSSRIIFQAPSPPSQKPSDADIFINPRGIRLILEEIKHNSTEDEKGYFWMQDPEILEDDDGVNPMKDYEIGADPFTHYIRILPKHEHQMVIEGDTRALMGLLAVLRCGLYHVKCQGKGHLSDATQGHLKNIEGILEAGKDDGGVEVRIGNMNSRAGIV